MRSVLSIVVITCLLISCDEERVFEKNVDFDSRYWLVSEKPEFEFEITDTSQKYNLYCNIRNTISYPYARIFITYYLQDSAGVELEKRLLSKLLFDEKSGEPQGNSGLGDIYDHRIALKANHIFPRPGKYKIKFEQFMRKDTLSGILAVGLRVEKAAPQP